MYLTSLSTGTPTIPDGATPHQASPAASRSAGLDLLRAAMVLLVIFHHTAITYGASGGWYYREVTAGGTPSAMILSLMSGVDQAFFMGLLFLLAGYFTPLSLARRGGWGYVKERLVRLGIPTLVYGFFLGPITIALAATAGGHPFAATLLALWGRGAFHDGPLWFAVALLIFTFAYLAWNRIAGSPEMRPPRFPSNATMAVAALLTGAAAFALRLVWPVGTVVTGNLQLGYFASYILLFAAGCIGARGRWLERIPEDRRRLWRNVAWIAFPVLPIAFILARHVPALQGNGAGGWNAQALVYAFWEPFLAWGIILALIAFFQRRFAAPGPIATALARRSFAIYVIHPIAVVGVALAWRDVPAPPIVKFALTGVASALLCFWVAGLLVRLPVVKRIL